MKSNNNLLNFIAGIFVIFITFAFSAHTVMFGISILNRTGWEHSLLNVVVLTVMGMVCIPVVVVYTIISKSASGDIPSEDR